jgi:hypothetical protein
MAARRVRPRACLVVPAIYVFRSTILNNDRRSIGKTWILGTSPRMTITEVATLPWASLQEPHNRCTGPAMTVF